ncbi:unnamed protein product [Medioppia subpectinata]|uniref:MACPF domain-containing protein n=1 Tax=Medioppia subpectinata TaxID=1979941 RepID=A0A7R9KWA7_9ACAR|nr:unnamed protein product [Medioppia subpectinata]CAG2110919.1 unnamed protein product [Medioppia subpectinata]
MRVAFTAFVTINMALIHDQIIDDLSQDITYLNKESLRRVVLLAIIITIILQIVFTIIFVLFILRESFAPILVMTILCLIAFLFDVGYIDTQLTPIHICELVFSLVVIVIAFGFAFLITSVMKSYLDFGKPSQLSADYECNSKLIKTLLIGFKLMTAGFVCVYLLTQKSQNYGRLSQLYVDYGHNIDGVLLDNFQTLINIMLSYLLFISIAVFIYVVLREHPMGIAFMTGLTIWEILFPFIKHRDTVAIGSTQAGDQCLNFPSGIQRMVRGIDVTKLDLSPADLAQSNGFQRALVSLTCKQGKKWQHPYDPSLVFDIPDQVDTINTLPGGVDTINTLPGGVINTKASIIETSDDYKKSKAFDLGLDANTVAYGAYAISGGYKKAQEELVNSTKSIVEVSAFVSAIRVDMSPYYEITPNKEFTDFVENILPETYAANPAKYQEFVDTFGTHYFDSAFFGGYVVVS